VHLCWRLKILFGEVKPAGLTVLPATNWLLSACRVAFGGSGVRKMTTLGVFYGLDQTHFGNVDSGDGSFGGMMFPWVSVFCR
jgi:hypothetical protein